MSSNGSRRRERSSLGLSSARFSRRCDILFITCVVCSVVLSCELGMIFSCYSRPPIQLR